MYTYVCVYVCEWVRGQVNVCVCVNEQILLKRFCLNLNIIYIQLMAVQ